MSHSLRRPLFQAVGFSPSISQRCFSQYRPLRALPTTAQSTAPRVRQSPEKSIRVEQQRAQMIPSDIGILEHTFVTPTGKNLPSLFSNFRDFFRLQGKRLKCRGRDWLMLMIFKWSSPKTTSFFRRDIKIRRSQTAPAAVALHKQMYTLFAEGDIPALRKICTDGLFESFHGRIASRARGEKVKWELVKYNKRTRVVSHRAARMPVDGMAVRQAVVRICSKQKLTRWRRGKDGKMEMVAGSGKEKDVVEYLVVQRMCRDWEEGDWRVWGTTGESTLEDVDMWERKALE